MAEGLIPIVVIASFGAIILGTLYCARWTMGPLERAAANSKAKVHCTIADILCLFVQIQLLLATFHGGWTMSGVLPAAVVLFILMVGFWWVSVVALERARVCNVWHRVFVLLIGTPLGVGGSIFACAIPAILLINATEGKWELLWLLPVALVVLGLLGGIRSVIGRIVAVAQSRKEG